MKVKYFYLFLSLLLLDRASCLLGKVMLRPFTRMLLMANNNGISASSSKNFISAIVSKDLESGACSRPVTRFPPEPNGHIHLGHAKSIFLNHGIARAFNGTMILRFDDTNPEKESVEYIQSIRDDVQWLLGDDIKAGNCSWDGSVSYSSNYFQRMYEVAEYLISVGLAYVDSLSKEGMRAYRGTLTEEGVDSPHRHRSISDNLALFQQMQRGEMEPGSCVLRAKINNSSPNPLLRDPVLYRVKAGQHPVTGEAWSIYPMYDFAQPLCDVFDGVTHSLCTEEFTNNRPLYDWLLSSAWPSGLLTKGPIVTNQSSGVLPNTHAVANQLSVAELSSGLPKQIEFTRLQIPGAVLSKRRLHHLVNAGLVRDWEDSRLLTIKGMRNRGVPASAIRLFCDRIGVSRADSTIPLYVFDDCIRETLDPSSPRTFAVLDPLEVEISNWSEDLEETFNISIYPRVGGSSRAIAAAAAGVHACGGSMDRRRFLHFTKRLVIDRSDFFDQGPAGETPVPADFNRLVLGGQTRLKNAFIIQCNDVSRDPVSGVASVLHCSINEGSRYGVVPPGCKRPKAIIHWLSKKYAVPATIVVSDPFLTQEVDESAFNSTSNNSSLFNSTNTSGGSGSEWGAVAGGAEHRMTQSLVSGDVDQYVDVGQVAQFERLGFFVRKSVAVDPLADAASVCTTRQPLYVFERVVSLRERMIKNKDGQA